MWKAENLRAARCISFSIRIKKILDKKKKVVKLWHAIHTKYEKIDFRFPSHSPSLWAM
jgi:hypothetical protein